MVAKIKEFVKAHADVLIWVLVTVLFVLFSFAAGYIMAKYQDRAPITITSE